jgi:arabinogalactan oligomer / maltooligosaccharide transport system permease protein
VTASGHVLEPTASTGRRRARGPFAAFKRGWARWWFAYAMLAPIAVVMGLLVFYPLVRGILFSFTDANRFNLGNKYIPSSYHYIGVKNYTDIFRSSEFRTVAAWTAIWTFVNVFFHVTIGLGLAVMLNRQVRFRGIYRMLLMIPWAIPSFISAYTWRFIFDVPYGFLSQVLNDIGIGSPAFLSDPTWAKVSVIMVNVWLGVPFMMVAFLGGLQSIDNDLLDASAVDGANALQRFWSVTLPGLRPVAATVTLLGLIWTFNMFNVIYLITGGGPANATHTFATIAYQYVVGYQLYGYAAAFGVVILSILLVFGTGYRWAVAKTGEETWS